MNGKSLIFVFIAFLIIFTFLLFYFQNFAYYERLNAKNNKEFDKADAIRQQLLEMSIEIKDTESGTDWTVKV